MLVLLVVKTCLIIQTAFIGDVVLATALIEELHQAHPDWQIDFLLNQKCQSILEAHPYIRKLWIWDKQHQKYAHLWKLLRQIRRQHYDVVINVQRFFSTGLLTAFSGATYTVGFDKNPWSFRFNRVVKHEMRAGLHEIDRNHALIAELTGYPKAFKPKLYVGEQVKLRISHWQQLQPYVCIAPASVWFTKQWPREKWLELIHQLPTTWHIFLLGSVADRLLTEWLCAHSHHKQLHNLAGELDLLESAALMASARMNFVNDSAPLHLASAMNAPTAAIFCSTVPAFGYGPLADVSYVIETAEQLSCRPCGLHGRKACPQKHFRCAWGIPVEALLKTLGL